MSQQANRKANSLTITYLAKVTFASLNGADKDVDNINAIKKITLPTGEDLPYISSQALRRALRDRLGENGWTLSPVQTASEKKGAAKTSLNPKEFIDDDLFGYMDAKAGQDGEDGTATTRTSPVRVEALVALSKYQGNLDYATNFMGKEVGANPNIFETEIHSGVYRGTIMIELDRVGNDKQLGKELWNVSNEERAKRVIAVIDSFRMLWSSGRQTRFLADISPKFIAAALMMGKNPIFLESVQLTEEGQVDVGKLQSVVSDYDKFIANHVFAAQEAVFAKADGVQSMKEGFAAIEQWVTDYYKD